MKRILLLATVLCLSLISLAQTPTKLSVDPKVRYGKLDNGLTYYIRHNAYPENRADFYIAQNVGSMQEEDSQQGLAHFLEHMAFNGSKHFAGRKSMLNYLETIGAKFGQNVNAYTSFDETVYNLSDIPMTRETIIDSCLLVLHDWSGFLSLHNEEIDKERLIIKEEWRTRDNANMRMLEKQLPTLFKDSKYANRLPIGSMDVVENFEYQVLKDYYHKWYRPDLQALIIVGDVDVDKVEAKIKKMFADIPRPGNPAKREYASIPDNKEPLIAVSTDIEATRTLLYLYIKHDGIPEQLKNTDAELTLSIVGNMASGMLSNRLAEIAQKPNAPFSGAYAFDGKYIVSKSKEAWTSLAVCKEGKTEESLAALIQENERVRLHGFTESEVERAKAELLQMYEDTYNNRNKQENDSYVNEYVRSFTDKEPIPGIEFEYEHVKAIAPMLSAQFINEYIKNIIKDENIVIVLSGPQKDGLTYPTEAKLLEVYSNTQKVKVDAYEETVSNEPLIKEMPKAGKVVKEEVNSALGSTLWTLSNGMKVSFKKTDFKDDEIQMTSSSHGGTSNIPVEDIFNAGIASSVPYIGGIGNFSATDLKKVLAGKSANVGVSIDQWGQTIGGSSNIKDMETMLQLTYLYFTAPRKDEDVYTSRIHYIREQLTNAENKPSTAFNEAVNEATNQNNPRTKTMKAGDVDNLDYDRAIEIYKTIFANPGSFIFSFVGNIDAEQLKPLVEQYLASLPSGKVETRYANIDMGIRKGEYKNTFEQKMENPKSSVYNIYSGTLERSQKNRMTLSALQQILDIVYTRTVREEEGGTYGVRVGANISRLPEGQTMLRILYDTNPEKVKDLNPIIERELKNIAENGPAAEDFQKVKEFMLKSQSQYVKENDYWLEILDAYYFYNEDNYSDHRKNIESITPNDVKELTEKLLLQGNIMEVIMMPKQ